MPPKRKAAAPAAAAAAAPAAIVAVPATPPAKRQKVVVPVDKSCPNAADYHVYADDSGPWDFTGNQTDVGNNNNKFYILQLLESNNGKTYLTWSRWGRVGADGQSMVVAQGASLEACQRGFEAKFKDKTKNAWADRANFRKAAGKYDMVHIDYSLTDAEAAEYEAKVADVQRAVTQARAASTLAPAVQELMELLFDAKALTAAVVEFNYDIKKMPLGKLTAAQVRAGYEALSRIEAAIKSGASTLEATNDFYTRIPHVFGMKQPPLIRTLEEVKVKVQLLDALTDAKIAMAQISAAESAASSLAIVDSNYASLHVDLAPIPRADEQFKMVETYVRNTHGHTHSEYGLDVLDVFSLAKDTPFTDGQNKMLLWHGSGLTNWVGILSQGLRIAPPEAPVSGYMFGKGVYFADMVSKSANYCRASRQKNVALLVLCEVVLDKPYETYASDCMLPKTLPKGAGSTWGKGQTGPDPKQSIKLGDVTVPLGKGIDTGARAPGGGYTLQYNEFIVYDTSRIRFKYLVKVRFDYKR